VLALVVAVFAVVLLAENARIPWTTEHALELDDDSTR